MKTGQPLMETVYGGGKKDCLAYGLALEAAGIDYEVYREAGQFIIVVAADDAAPAHAEIEAYARDSRDWPNAGDEIIIPRRSNGWAGVLGYVAILVFVAILAHKDSFGHDWCVAGSARAGLIRSGQTWRSVTALMLHVDLSHLSANVVLGSLIGLFAGQLLGSGLAWASILVAGAVGNFFNAWIRDTGHTSVGASTAVFASLGIVAAYAWSRPRPTRTPRLTRVTPLIGAVVLLSFLGTGGGRTDVGAHITGFVSGLFLGAVYGTLGDEMQFGRRAQILLGIGALAVLTLAWTFALAYA